MKQKASTKDPATTAEWTIMVYMAGDNDLDDFGQSDVMEMKKTGSSDKIHILVQRDTAAAGVPTVRYRARKGTSLNDDIVEKLGETNCGDPKVLADFIAWGMTNYPAKRTMAVLWNHGNGWDDTDVYHESKRRSLNPPPERPAGSSSQRRSGLPGRGSIPAGFIKRSVVGRRFRGSFFMTAFQLDGKRRAIAFDDDAQDFLDNVEMKKVFDAAVKKAGRKFDVIGMDACLMAMLETGVQVESAGNVFCGSEQTEPGAGWPYDRILKVLAAKPTMDGKALASLIAKEYSASYPKSEATTQSALDLTVIGALRKATDALGAQLAKGLSSKDLSVRGAVGVARAQSQGYEHPDYIDLWDFTANLVKYLPATAPAVKAVQSAISKAVLANYAPNPSVNRSHGISIYLPAGKSSKLYDTLVFASGGWAKFVKAWAPVKP